MTNTLCSETMPIPQRGTRVAVMMLELCTMMVINKAMIKRMTWVNHLILPGNEALIAENRNRSW